jgi:hypothetical protein
LAPTQPVLGPDIENDMEPRWKLLKDLAKSGTIGRTAVADVDFGKSLASRETDQQWRSK